uniref:glutathione transferase n=1 Tax=Acrobeloides nanus TaxID=290746 RepID=A0A914DBV9_9BILA
MVHYKISYFDARSLGEPVRLILKYANVPFEDDRIPKDQWPTRKLGMPYNQIPVLWVDGIPLAQSYAIYRFLAKKYGLAGKDDFESAQIDEIADFHKDVTAELSQYLYKKLGFVPGNAVC